MMPKPIASVSKKLKAVLRHKYLLWGILSLPALQLFWPIITGGYLVYGFRVSSGEWAVRLLILTLAITPLSLLFGGQTWVRWLIAHRRHFGVACAAYAMLHVGYYIWDVRSLGRILFVAEQFHAWSGWLTMGLLLILAVTSNNFSQRVMASQWKNLQRLTYVAVIFGSLHWLMVARGDKTVTFIQIGILTMLELFRFGYRLHQWRKQRFRDLQADLSG